MDREMNFLLQSRGTKTVRLWDPADDEIMTAAQKDELLAYGSELRPQYRDSFERKAMIFELSPGLGVHHPFIAPHLVQTGPELSISLAITFRTVASDTWTDAHAFNHKARTLLRLNPAPVRANATRDRMKAAAIRTYRRLRKTINGVRPP
jgi:hypothetical protein